MEQGKLPGDVCRDHSHQPAGFYPLFDIGFSATAFLPLVVYLTLFHFKLRIMYLVLSDQPEVKAG